MSSQMILDLSMNAKINGQCTDEQRLSEQSRGGRIRAEVVGAEQRWVEKSGGGQSRGNVIR
jgi:hypothetical protein